MSVEAEEEGVQETGAVQATCREGERKGGREGGREGCEMQMSRHNSWYRIPSFPPAFSPSPPSLLTSYASIPPTILAACIRDTCVGSSPRARREVTLSTGCESRL